MFHTEVVEKIKTHILSISFFFYSFFHPPSFAFLLLPSKYHGGYEIMWKSVVELNKQWKAVWLVLCACWMSTAINTHSDMK
jgi:hypothetical protein